MVTERDIDKFARKNETDLRKFMVYKTHIIDRDVINESIQEFYIRLIESKALDTFDEKKGTFDTYIMNLFCWTLPALKRRNVLRNRNMVSVARIENATVYEREEKDIWDCLHMHPYYKVEPSFSNSNLEQQEEEELDQNIQDFIAYIKKTEKKKKADRMILFIKHRREGCLSEDIAVIMGVASNLVKEIKQELTEKFKKWQRRNQWL